MARFLAFFQYYFAALTIPIGAQIGLTTALRFINRQAWATASMWGALAAEVVAAFFIGIFLAQSMKLAAWRSVPISNRHFLGLNLIAGALSFTILLAGESLLMKLLSVPPTWSLSLLDVTRLALIVINWWLAAPVVLMLTTTARQRVNPIVIGLLVAGATMIATVGLSARLLAKIGSAWVNVGLLLLGALLWVIVLQLMAKTPQIPR